MAGDNGQPLGQNESVLNLCPDRADARVYSRSERCLHIQWDVNMLLKQSLDINMKVLLLLSCVWLFATPWTAAHWASLSFTISQSLLNSCPLSQWCHPAIPSSVTPFSSCPQSSLASGSFPVSQLVALGGPSIGTSASASILPMNIQGWFPLGLTGLISLLSKGLWRIFSSTTICRHQFFSA